MPAVLEQEPHSEGEVVTRRDCRSVSHEFDLHVRSNDGQRRGARGQERHADYTGNAATHRDW